MKKILLISTMILCGSMIIWSQVPQAMNYKAIAKDDWGVALPNKAITLRFTIIEGSATGTEVYREIHYTVTNKFGLMDVEIGKGIPDLGIFSAIVWSTGIYYIKIEMDPKGGSDFRLEDPPHQLLSVPYALYAGSAPGSFSGYYSDLIDAPFLEAVATSGNYSDLLNKPSNLSQFFNDLSFLTEETDPLFSVHPANGITTESISNWNTAFGWGSHIGLYKPISYLPIWSEINENPFLITSPSESQLLRFNSVSGKWENWLPDFLTIELDGSITNEIQTLTLDGNVLSLTEGGTVTLPSSVISGQYFYADRDNDAFGDQYSPVWVPSGVEPPAHFVADNTDCNDNNALVHPDLSEILDNLDNDCDGIIDEDIPVCSPGSTDIRPCGSLPGVCFNSGTQTRVCGTGGTWSDWSVCEGEILPSPEICDGLDNDCDGQTDEDALCPNGQCIAGVCVEVDLDGDGYTENQGDCNDNDAGIHPGAVEICGDGIDQDCDGEDRECIACIDWEGNEYQTVQIGDQIWMAENLKSTKYNDGTDMVYQNGNEWLDTEMPCYSWYDHDAISYKATYGALYNWYAVNTGSLCPVGWHVPVDADWTELTDYLGGWLVAGGKLKESGTTHWESSNDEATNETGFTALPGGYRNDVLLLQDQFNEIGRNGMWWSSQEYSSTDAYLRTMGSGSAVGRGYYSKRYSLSVRCLKD